MEEDIKERPYINLLTSKNVSFGYIMQKLPRFYWCSFIKPSKWMKTHFKKMNVLLGKGFKSFSHSTQYKLKETM